MAQPKMLPTRGSLPVELTWDLTTIFKTDNDFEVALAKVKAQQPKATRFKGTLTKSGATLAQALDYQMEVYQALEKVYVYANLKNSEDTGNAKYQGYNAQASSLAASIGESFAFVVPEILAIPTDTLSDFREHTPELAVYDHFLKTILATKDHVLSTEAESLLAGASDIFGLAGDVFEVLSNANLAFPTVKDENGAEITLSEGVYGRLIESTNREVRKAAFTGLYQVYHQFMDTLAQTLSGNVKAHNYTAKVHHYPSARAAALANNEIPEQVYDTLVTTVNENLPLLHRYVALRKKILGLSKLHMYDVYTPITGTPSLTYQFDAAKKEALNALAVMGPDYNAIVQEAFNKRWIDVPENKGKRTGAFSGGAYDTNPFILLNWQDNLNNLYTLVHEMGHSVHSYFTRHQQPYLYGDYSIFVAEIASTTNENTLTDYLLKTQTDKKVRAYVLNHYLDGFKGTIFRQTQFAEFEQLIHTADQAGTPLTAEFLTEKYGELNQRYYGPEMSADPQIAYEWTRIPHFYYNYYVYQYATGFAAATMLSDAITNGQPNALDRYLDFLKAGSSADPITIMKKAGVDMTQKDYLENAFKVFETRLNEFESLLDQLN